MHNRIVDETRLDIVGIWNGINYQVRSNCKRVSIAQTVIVVQNVYVWLNN